MDDCNITHTHTLITRRAKTSTAPLSFHLSHEVQSICPSPLLPLLLSLSSSPSPPLSLLFFLSSSVSPPAASSAPLSIITLDRAAVPREREQCVKVCVHGEREGVCSQGEMECVRVCIHRGCVSVYREREGVRVCVAVQSSGVCSCVIGLPWCRCSVCCPAKQLSSSRALIELQLVLG